MEHKSDKHYEIKTTKTVFKIIETLTERNGATLSETADTIDKSVSATHNHLKTLEDMGYVAKRSGQYHVGLQFLDHGMYALRQQEVRTVAQKPLEKLAEDTEEIIWLVKEEHGKTFPLDNCLGERAVQTDGDVGRPKPIHCTAHGKAILANLPRSRVDEIIDMHGLPMMTEHTITERDALLRELETIREQGYAVNNEESVIGVRAIGSAIRGEASIHGAVSITGPVPRMTDERIDEDFLDPLLATVDDIRLRLRYEHR